MLGNHDSGKTNLLKAIFQTLNTPVLNRPQNAKLALTLEDSYKGQLSTETLSISGNPAQHQHNTAALFDRFGTTNSLLQWLLHIEVTTPTLFEHIKSLGSGLLGQTPLQLSVNKDGLVFKVAQGPFRPLHMLSKSTQAVLLLYFSILEQLHKSVSNGLDFEGDTVQNKGLVLIDDFEQFLSPQRQVYLSKWLLKHFPNTQFLVSSFSPFVCRATKAGQLFKLVRTAKGSHIKVLEVESAHQIIYGDILDAYAHPDFEQVPCISPEGQKGRKRLAELRLLAQLGRILPDEQKELQALQNLYASHVDPS